MLRAALEVLGWAIEAADADRSDAWYLRETEHGLRLMAGRLFACELRRSRLRVSVIGPVADDVLGTLGAEIEDELKWIPGGQIVGMPLDKAATALSLLKDAMDAFIDSAMSRVRRAVEPGRPHPRSDQLPVNSTRTRSPQPEPGSELSLSDGNADAEEEDVGLRTPATRDHDLSRLARGHQFCGPRQIVHLPARPVTTPHVHSAFPLLDLPRETSKMQSSMRTLFTSAPVRQPYRSRSSIVLSRAGCSHRSSRPAIPGHQKLPSNKISRGWRTTRATLMPLCENLMLPWRRR